VIAASSLPDAGSAEHPRVLLADDHPALLALTAAALAGECLVVGSVGDGRELLAEAERLQPDVIVLDITMPRLDGIEAARQLRRSHRPARLVFLTVHEDADFARAALDAGGLGYVVKARLASDLLPAMRAAVDGPDAFAVYKGKLYLCGNEGALKEFKSDIDSNIGKADTNWRKLTGH
jgi:DNA-binding NarL/FixJ family response regulator